jgi:hypothetical protein
MPNFSNLPSRGAQSTSVTWSRARFTLRPRGSGASPETLRMDGRGARSRAVPGRELLLARRMRGDPVSAAAGITPAECALGSALRHCRLVAPHARPRLDPNCDLRTHDRGRLGPVQESAVRPLAESAGIAQRRLSSSRPASATTTGRRGVLILNVDGRKLLAEMAIEPAEK